MWIVKVIKYWNQVEEEEKEEGSGKHVMMSILNLVDLAGSERADQTGAEGSRSVCKSTIFSVFVILSLASHPVFSALVLPFLPPLQHFLGVRRINLWGKA